MSDNEENAEERSKRLQGERAAALRWVSQKWTNRTCPICGNTGWQINDVMELRQYNHGNLIVGAGSSIVPVIPIMCLECGYTVMFNAIQAQVIDTNGDSVHHE